jgi:hypothetical protein
LGKRGRGRFLVPVLLYSSLVFTFVQSGANTPRFLFQLLAQERVFDEEVSFLVA